MIVLDTNVVSEMMKPQPSAAVRQWLNEQAAKTLYLTSVTLAELRFGLAVMPTGQRKQQLTQVVDGLTELYAGRILAFDCTAANCYADLALTARQSGRGFGYIAAIAAAHGFIIASRDTAPFAAGRLQVINPWVIA